MTIVINVTAINRRMSYIVGPAPVPIGLSLAIHFKPAFPQFLVSQLFSSKFFSSLSLPSSSRSFDCFPRCAVGSACSVVRITTRRPPQKTRTREPTYFGDRHSSGSRLGQRTLPVFPLSALF